MPNDRARLEAALAVAAQLVARDGEVFLPVFLRLEAEVAAGAERQSALERARALSEGAGAGGAGRSAQSAIRSSAAARPASAPPSP